MASLTTYRVFSEPTADDFVPIEDPFDPIDDESPTGPRTYRIAPAYHVITVAGYVVIAGVMALLVLIGLAVT